MIFREPWAGRLGCYVENIAAGSFNILTDTFFSVDSGNVSFNDGLETGVKLTPGVWELMAHIQCIGAATTTMAQASVTMGTQLGVLTGGVDGNRNAIQYGPFAAAGLGSAPARGTFTSPAYRVRVLPGTTQTWYAKADITFATSTMAVAGGIRATLVALI